MPKQIFFECGGELVAVDKEDYNEMMTRLGYYDDDELCEPDYDIADLPACDDEYVDQEVAKIVFKRYAVTHGRIANLLREMRELFNRNPGFLENKYLMNALYHAYGEERINGAVCTARKAMRDRKYPAMMDRDLDIIRSKVFDRYEEQKEEISELKKRQKKRDLYERKKQREKEAAIKKIRDFWEPRMGKAVKVKIDYQNRDPGFVNGPIFLGHEFIGRVSYPAKKPDGYPTVEGFYVEPIFTDWLEAQENNNPQVRRWNIEFLEFLGDVSDEELTKIKFVQKFRRKLDLGD